MDMDSINVEIQLLWIVPLITLAGIIANIIVIRRLQKQNRIAEFITQERIKWTKDLREYFVLFNKYVSMVVHARSKGEVDADSFIKLRESYDHILLMLNPNEDYHVKVVDAHSDVLRYANAQLRDKKISGTFKKSHVTKLQNVLLKSEWARIKRETDSGKILTDSEVEKIYNDLEEKAFSTKVDDEIMDNT